MVFNGDSQDITDYEMLQCYKAENRQLRREKAALLKACEAALSMYDHGGSLAAHDRAKKKLEAAIALARGEEARDEKE